MALPGFNVKKVPTVQNKLIEEIVDYLNTRAGTKYKHDAKNTVKYISARLREGYTIEDFKYVIDVKVAEWGGTNMEMYIRPQTLFSNKMENYVNQPMPRSNRASYQVENDYKHDTTNRRI
jgi:uncharacterized phage protein (TIGR02220 family)|nr:MAG TPA: hypothetical protein [Caudoviricetes sp.]